jgi:hypothetical protein
VSAWDEEAEALLRQLAADLGRPTEDEIERLHQQDVAHVETLALSRVERLNRMISRS